MTAADRERHGKQLEEEGYTILPEVLSRSEIEQTKVAIDETLESEADIARRYGLQNENLLMAFNAQGKHPHFYGLLTRNPEPVEDNGVRTKLVNGQENVIYTYNGEVSCCVRSAVRCIA